MKRVFRVLALVLLLALLSSSAFAGGWEPFEQPADVGVRYAPYMKYWVYTPDEMKPGLPFVIYLHSSDGISWSAMKDVLPELITNGTIADPQAVILLPQLTRDHRLTWSDVIVSLNTIVETVMAEYEVDPSRVALTGFSLGGIGLWELASLAPDRYVRLLCIGGKANAGIDPAAFTVCEGIKVFSSTGDLKANRVNSEQFVEALLDAGANASFELLTLAHTEGPRLVYADKDIQKWLWLIPDEDAAEEPAAEEAVPSTEEPAAEEAAEEISPAAETP